MYTPYLFLLSLAGLFSTFKVTFAFKLTILHVNDGESEVLPNGDFGGADRLVALVDELEQGEPGLVKVSC